VKRGHGCHCPNLQNALSYSPGAAMPGDPRGMPTARGALFGVGRSAKTEARERHFTELAATWAKLATGP
jgi:hypothetical protein